MPEEQNEILNADVSTEEVVDAESSDEAELEASDELEVDDADVLGSDEPKDEDIQSESVVEGEGEQVE